MPSPSTSLTFAPTPSSTNVPINSSPLADSSPTLLQPQNKHPMLTHSRTGHSCPKRFLGFQAYHSSKHPIALHTSTVPTAPSSFTNDIKLTEWHKAMDEEFCALQVHHTWSI